MTYRERRLAKAERLREWAEKRSARAQQAERRVNSIADGIPLGQPILVGHHSEGHARRDAERIRNGMHAVIEHRKKAAEFERRADGIEHAADRAIYSDDPDAVEALTLRIADLEAQRERIKAYNVSCRRGTPNLMMLDERQRASLISALAYSPEACKDGAFPDYGLKNLGGNIKRLGTRLEDLEAVKVSKRS